MVIFIEDSNIIFSNINIELFCLAVLLHCIQYSCREEDSSSYETVTDSESDTAPDKQDEAKARYCNTVCH